MYVFFIQADIDAGEISDEASVVSLSPAPSPSDVIAVASCTTSLPRQPGVEIFKSVTDVTAASGYDPLLTDAGDTFTYLITVSNTGNTWLSDVAVSDPMLDNTGEGLGCGSAYVGNSSRFAPGGTFDCTVVLTLEQEHIDERCVDSTANVRLEHREGRSIVGFAPSLLGLTIRGSARYHLVGGNGWRAIPVVV